MSFFNVQESDVQCVCEAGSFGKHCDQPASTRPPHICELLMCAIEQICVIRHETGKAYCVDEPALLGQKSTPKMVTFAPSLISTDKACIHT